MNNCIVCNKPTPNQKCCSQACGGAYGRSHRISQQKSLNKCLWCQKLTANDKFCSRSCSASIRNKKVKRSKTSYFCIKCNNVIGKGYRFKNHKYCKSCFGSSSKTLAEIKLEQSQLSNFHSIIRSHARRVFKQHHKKMICMQCQYSLHIDVCHKVPVSDFPDTATLNEVNHPSNLIGLCKNHHWEFDHGYLSIE